MIRSLFLSCLSICSAVVPAAAEITAEQIAGKTVVSDGGTFVIGAGGTLSGTVGKGDQIGGTWAVKDGQWCRTISTPKRHAGSACQAASIKGTTLTVTRADGSEVSFRIK